MATLDDILTTQKNGVIAINNLSNRIAYERGQYTSVALTAQTSVVVGKGLLVSFSVVVAGTTAGTINNASSTGSVAATNALVSVPTTTSVYSVGMKFDSGLVVTPGTGQTVVVTYSLG